jgi:hypothetical protein
VGAARICQIKKSALQKVRVMLDEYKDPEDKSSGSYLD